MSNRQPGCKAQYQRDGTMRCDACDFTWDLDDPEPPACLTDVELQSAERKRGRAAIDNLKESLK